MAIGTFQLQKIRADGTQGPALNDFVELQVSDVWNSIPSIGFSYPAEAAFRDTNLTTSNFNEVRLVYLDDNNVVQEPRNCRFIIDEQEWDPIPGSQEGASRRYIGAGLMQLLDWTRLWPTLAEGASLSYSLQSPGAIMGDMVTRFDSRWAGVLNPPRIWTIGFSNTNDAGGVPWAFTTSMTLSRGYSFLQLVNDLKDNGQVFPYFQGRDFRPFRADYGVDRADSGSGEVLLQAGQQITRSNVKQSSRALVQATGGVTGGNLSQWWVPAAILRDGMVREEYVPDSNTGDLATRDAALQLILDQRADKQRQFTLEVNLENSPFLPYVHFRAGDWIWADLKDTEIGRVKIKLMQVAMTLDRGGRPVSATLVGEDFFDPPPRRTTALLKALRHGRIKLPA